MSSLRRSPFLAIAAVLLLVGSAHAQSNSTTSTTTKTKTTTSTTGTSWKTPDGTKGGSSSTTTTNTRSQSTTIGKAAPAAPSRPAPGLPAPGSSAGIQWLGGAWNASGPGGSCTVQLYANMDSGGGATSHGCKSDINGIGNWALRGNTLLLIKNVFTTAATLQRTGPSRFDGSTASGEPISIWR